MGHPIEDRQAVRRGLHPAAIFAIVGAVLAAIVIAFIALAGSGQRAASNACHAAVTQQLAAPASAHWRDEVVTKTASGYVVAGSVDAQNAFGAMLPTYYRCTVTNGTAVVDTP